MHYRVGIDVGGTFTDFALLADSGDLHIYKSSTVPGDIARGCLEGLAVLLREAGVAPTDVSYWSHGSTVATNAVVERKGARTALLATEGFKDILEIRRQVKPDRYSLHHLKPEPLVPRSRRLEVRERILWDGSVHQPLDQEQLNALSRQLQAIGVEAVAICFLHAYANPVHEQAVVEHFKRSLPGVYVSASYVVLPEFREYPRTSTTVVNAYVGPLIQRYLERFSAGGQAMGIEPPLNIFQSNGGISSASGATQLPVRVLYSGPAAGVRGSTQVAGQAGFANVITFDMGGTSCDVCLIRNGNPLTFVEREIDGFPIRTPMIDVHSIGAGGGSIAWVDKGGLLQVGPRSAGAEPGPAAYGRGGMAATVTDANLVLGRLNPRFLLGGRLPVHLDKAQAAIDALAEPLHLPREQVALGIVDVVNSNMMGAIRVVSVERGQDYRDCALMAFGGAGPLHAGEVAQDIGISSVLVPGAPGILCALGLLLADYQSDFTRTRIMPAQPERWQEMQGAFAALESQAWEWATEHGIPTADAQLLCYVYARIVGQSYQLRVATGPIQSPADVTKLVEAFHQTHEASYGFAHRTAPVEAVDFHLVLLVPVPRPRLNPRQQRRTGRAAGAQIGERTVWFKSLPTAAATPIYQRDLLPVACEIAGPAILEQIDSTTVVPPGASATVDEWGNVCMTVKPRLG